MSRQRSAVVARAGATPVVQVGQRWDDRAVIVKVCGVRTPEVAAAAVEAGADWIGLVFEPRSPRYVDDAAAAAVRSAVAGAADLVGVVVSPSLDLCHDLVARHRLAALQIHGDIDPNLAAEIDVPVIRAINVGDVTAACRIDWWADGIVLLDASVEAGALPGGTGRGLPWEWAEQVARHRRVVLAGGLGPDNVADAIVAVRPYGVDASSRLESAPGVKDIGLVRAFVRAARAAFALLDSRPAVADEGRR